MTADRVSYKNPHAAKLIICDTARRNRALLLFTVFLALVLAVVQVRRIEESSTVGMFAFLVVVAIAAALGSDFFSFCARDINAFHATLPMTREQRGRIMWFQKVVLTPLVLFGPSLVASTYIAFTGANKMALAMAYPAILLAGLIAIQMLSLPEINIDLGWLKLPLLFLAGWAGLRMSRALPLWFSACLSQPLLIGALVLSYVRAERLAIDVGRLEKKRLKPLLPALAQWDRKPLSFWWMMLQEITPRFIILAVYLYLVIPASGNMSHLRQAIGVGIPAFIPFAFPAIYLCNRFKVVRALPVSSTQLSLAAYGYALVASIFSAGVTILAFHKLASDTLPAAFYINSALLGMFVGTVMPVTVFAIHWSRRGLAKFIGIVILMTVCLLMDLEHQALQRSPIFSVFLFACACLTIGLGVQLCCRLIEKSDGNDMSIVL